MSPEVPAGRPHVNFWLVAVVEFVGDDARGLAVHAAARVMSVGGPDDVLMSSATYELLEGSGLTLEEAGTHDMKGLPGARKVFRLVLAAA